jgi:hypothetical protein
VEDERRRRAEHNEAVFRRANERLREDWRRLGIGAEEEGLFLCECGDVTCKEPVRVRLSDYERVRAHPDTFLLVPGHEDAAVESVADDVLAESNGFNVVRKHGAPS